MELALINEYMNNRTNALNRSATVLPELKGKVGNFITALKVAYKKAQKTTAQISAKVEASDESMKKLGGPLEQILGA